MASLVLQEPKLFDRTVAENIASHHRAKVTRTEIVVGEHRRRDQQAAAWIRVAATDRLMIFVKGSMVALGKPSEVSDHPFLERALG